MTSTEQQPRPMNREIITTVAQAFRVLGIINGISSQREINDVFRSRVKAVHQHGTYARDMDALTQAKDVLTNALKQALEQAERDQARTRAQAQEQEERERTKANQQKRESEASQQKEEPTKSEAPTASDPLLLGPGRNRDWEALRTYERQKAREREQTRRLWSYQGSDEQERTRREQQAHYQHRGGKARAMQPQQPESGSGKQELAKPQSSDNSIQSALQLFQQRQAELERTRVQERELEEALSCAQQQRSQLEQTMQTANALADQLHTVLSQSRGKAEEGMPQRKDKRS